jgi:hypothetical protein
MGFLDNLSGQVDQFDFQWLGGNELNESIGKWFRIVTSGGVNEVAQLVGGASMSSPKGLGSLGLIFRRKGEETGFYVDLHGVLIEETEEPEANI